MLGTRLYGHPAGLNIKKLSSDECRRRFYKNWYKSKQKAFTKYAKRYTDAAKSGTAMAAELERTKNYCQVVRAIVHTQVTKAKIGQKKAHIKEIQINGGTTAEKVDFVTNLFEQEVNTEGLFTNQLMLLNSF